MVLAFKNPKITRRLRVVRFVILLGVLVLGGGLVYGLHKFQLKRQSGSLLIRADEFAAKQDWPSALKLYQNYLNFQPRDASGLEKYAVALEETAKTNRAMVQRVVDVYERLLRLDGGTNEHRKKLARHYLSLGASSTARKHLKHLMSEPGFAKEPDAAVLEMAGHCDLLERLFPDAAEYYRRAVATGHAENETYYRLANLLQHDINTEASRSEAARLMEQFISESPNDVQRRLLRAKFYFHMDKPALARQDIDYAYNSIPGGAENSDVILALTELALADNKLAEAKAVLTKAVAALPKDNRLRLALADVQTQLDEPEEATATLKAAAAAIPGADLALIEIADKLIELGDRETATQQAARFLEDKRFPELGRYLQARLHLVEGNWPAARTELNEILALDPGITRFPKQHLFALLALADCHRLANDPDERLKAVDRALRLDPESISAKLVQAETLQSLHRTADAMKIYLPLVTRSPAARLAAAQLRLKGAIEQNEPERSRTFSALDSLLGSPPYQGELLLVRVSSLLARDRRKEAVDLLEEALAKSPKFASAWVALAYARNAMGTGTTLGLEVLDRAEKTALDRVDLRLARAQLLARSATPDVAAIQKLADHTKAFTTLDQYRLNMGLASELTRLTRFSLAFPLYRQAAAKMPYDLSSRLAAFDLANHANDTAAQAEILAELTTIEGADGPTKRFAEAIQQLRSNPPSDVKNAQPLREKLLSILAVRPSWGRVHALLGDLSLGVHQTDAAIESYREAVHLGETNTNLIRNLTQLLLQRQNHAEARDLLTRVSRSIGLPPDLVAQLTVLRAAFGADAEENLRWALSADVEKSASYRDHLIRATVLANHNRLPEARRALETAVSLGGSETETWPALVRFLAATGKTKEAEAAAEQASRSMKPAGNSPADRAVVAVAKGTCQELLGRFDTAESDYRDAVTLDGNSIQAHANLIQLLARANRTAEAQSHLEALIPAASTSELRRWARRQSAYLKVQQIDGYAQIPQAVALIEENLRESDSREDRRAKAIILATDPFQREAAIALLTAEPNVPLTAEQSYMLGQLQAQAGRLDLAELALRDATRASAIAAPEYFARLIAVQLKRGNPTSAEQTLDHLKRVSPKSWLTTEAEARILAAQRKLDAASRLLLDRSKEMSTSDLTSRVGPLLEELEAWSAAEKVYQRAMADSKEPSAFVPLARHWIRADQPDRAVELAFRHQNEVPAGVTARLLASAARSRALPLLPKEQQAVWQQQLQKIDEWVIQKAAAAPKDLNLLKAKAILDDVNGRYDAAIATYEAALSLSPSDAEVLNNLAMLLALHRKDHSQRSLEMVNRIIELRGLSATVLDTRAVTHLAAGRLPDAERDLRVVLALKTKPVYLFHLAQFYDRQPDQTAEFIRTRNETLQLALRQGLKKSQLHPLEWQDFDRFLGREEGVKR